jgi:hypothetical protein
MRAARSWLALLACAALEVAGGGAHAAVASPRIEVTVIQARRTGGPASMDPRLRDLADIVKSPAFARYDTYRLLDRRELPLTADPPAADLLANGRTLRVRLVDTRGVGADRRFHLSASIDRPDQTPYVRAIDLTAPADEPFFLAGQAFAGGILVLELVVHE